MARTVKPEQFAAKRGDILDATTRLVFTKGFEQMSIQDILDEARISNGAFHHYFGSREALLEAFTERMGQASEKPLRPILDAPDLNAIQKLQGFFDTLDSLRQEHQATILQVWRAWYTDANALVRLRVDEAILRQRAPLVQEIVQQGIREGLFHCVHPEMAGEIVLNLQQGMGNAHARLLLSLESGNDPRARETVARVVAIHAAYLDAIERVLGAPNGCLVRVQAPAVQVLIDTLPRKQGA